MDMTENLGGTPNNGLNRRKFLKGMAATAGLGLGTGLLAACGDNTPTSPAQAALVAATTVSSTTAAATTAAPTTAASTTVAATTVAPTTVAPTTVAPTTAAAPTSASAVTTAAASGAAPAGYIEVGKVSASGSAPVAFTSGSTKGYVFTRSASEVFVYSNVCTHMGCEVSAFKTTDNAFECPCHGSKFTNTGDLVNGPAKTSLPLFDNKVIGDVIYAKLS
jgi:Rieske Fe-S protein